MKRKTFPIDQIEKLIEEGKTTQEIAIYFGTTRPTISKFLKSNKVKTKNQAQCEYCKKLDVDLICKKYLLGATIRELSTEFKVSDTAIKSRLKEKNIHIRTNSESHRIYTLNENYFNKIDTPDKAYILGFICADGCITDKNELTVKLNIKDKDWVLYLQNELNTNRPIVYSQNGESCELRVNSKIICNDLKKYAVYPRKSLTLNIEDVITKANIKEPLLSLFLLGYYDGDGRIYHYQKEGRTEQYSCSITGTYETCGYFKQYFNNVGFYNKRFPERNNNNVTYQIGGRNLVYNSLSKLYKNSSQLKFFLIRKKNIFDSIKRSK